MNISPRRLRLLVLIPLLLVVVVTGVAITKVTVSKGLDIKIDANGHARLYGIPLANTNVERAVFSALASLGAKCTISTIAFRTNDAASRNRSHTIRAMVSAGILRSAQSPPLPASVPSTGPGPLPPPPPTDPNTPRPPGQPVTARSAPFTMQFPDVIPAGGVRFWNTDLQTALAIYRDMAAGTVDVEEQIKFMHPRIGLTNREPVSRSQLLGLFEKALHEQAGIVATHAGTNHVALSLERSP